MDFLNNTCKYDEDYISLAASNFLHLDSFMCAMDIRSKSEEYSAASMVIQQCGWKQSTQSLYIHLKASDFT